MSKQIIVIAGGTGLVGSRLLDLIDSTKYKIIVLTRSPKAAHGSISYAKWDTTTGYVDPIVLKADHVINLAGAGIADQRWTKSRKKLLINSRVDTTTLLYRTFDTNHVRLKSYIGASAIGYYGDRDDEKLTETAVAGNDFLSECCVLWESAHHQMEQISTATSILRIGIVMSTNGGAFSKIHPPMKFGMANYFGNGKQYYSWIHIDDLCHMIIYLIQNPEGHKTYNAVAPDPDTNKVFIQKIKKGLKSLAIVAPAPEFALKLMLGEMSKVVLNSTRVYPKQISNTSFEYRYPLLEDAVQDIVESEI